MYMNGLSTWLTQTTSLMVCGKRLRSERLISGEVKMALESLFIYRPLLILHKEETLIQMRNLRKLKFDLPNKLLMV
jgi:hypothetical protein